MSRFSNRTPLFSGQLEKKDNNRRRSKESKVREKKGSTGGQGVAIRWTSENEWEK